MKAVMLFGLAAALLVRPVSFGATQGEDTVREAVMAHALALHGPGELELLREARAHDLFLLGELHGENEIPQLVRDLWPEMWANGYRHVAAEVSPWAASQFERGQNSGIDAERTLWTQDQAGTVRQFAKPGETVLWGCDIDEGQPERLIADMARLNARDATAQKMLALTAHGYERREAAELFALWGSGHPVHDANVGGVSLWQSIGQTLSVEALRADPKMKMAASEARERRMKELFLGHVREQPQGKIFLRFGRNHLHRGEDARGVSTLGNFVTEWGIAENKSVVNVGAFAAGGKEHLAGETFDADERQDELSFAFLAQIAAGDATVFDLRPLRPLLHGIEAAKRTALEVNLIYWADSYDFLICYPVVTPLRVG